MTPASSFLDALKSAADESARAEDVLRRDYIAKLKALEVERAFAHRRLNFMRGIAEVVASAESEEIAVAAATAVMRVKLGWQTDSEARAEVLGQFAPVAKSVFAHLDPEPAPDQPPSDVLATLKEFEAWYAGSRGSAFWVLFENYIPETPLVDF